MKTYFRPCASAPSLSGKNRLASWRNVVGDRGLHHLGERSDPRRGAPCRTGTFGSGASGGFDRPGGPDPRHRLVRILPHLTGEEGVPKHFMAAMRGALMEFPTPRLRGLSGARTALQIPALHKRRCRSACGRPSSPPPGAPRRRHLSLRLRARRDRPGSVPPCLPVGLEGMVSKHRESSYRGGRFDRWINRQHPAYSRVADQFITAANPCKASSRA
jgi:hypothetical protein